MFYCSGSSTVCVGCIAGSGRCCLTTAAALFTIIHYCSTGCKGVCSVHFSGGHYCTEDISENVKRVSLYSILVRLIVERTIISESLLYVCSQQQDVLEASVYVSICNAQSFSSTTFDL